MKVKELIEKLKEMPQDADVYVEENFFPDNRTTDFDLLLTKEGKVILGG
jgi:hypothetical protein